MSTNLFDISTITATNNIIVNDDKSLTVSGYPSNSTVLFKECCPNVKVGDTVCFSMETDGYYGFYLLQSKTTWNKNSNTYVITEEMLNSRICFYRQTSAQGGGDATIRNFQINLGTTPLEYEPYGYKTPVKVRGRNLFNVNAIGTLGTYSDFIQNGDGTITVGGYSSSTKETLSQLCPDLKVGDNLIVTMETEGVDVIYLQGTKTTLRVNRSYTVKQEDLDGRVGFYCRRVDGVNYPATISKIQFQLDEVGDYEPYVESTTTNIYLKEPLRKIRDIKDYIDFESKKVVRNIGVRTTGFTQYSFTASTNYLYLKNATTFSDNMLPNSINCMSNKIANFKTFPGSVDVNALMVSGTTFYYFVLAEESEIQTYIDLLAETEIHYILKKPDDTETIELPNIPTHKGTTIIEVDTTIQPSNMEVQYYGKEVA